MPITDSIESIAPCPFSKGYRIPVRQAWRSLSIFLLYRFVLASLFISVFYAHFEPSLLNINNKLLFFYSSHLYLLLSIVAALCVPWRVLGYAVQAHWLVFSDMVMLILLMHACGGISSGVGVLLAVSIAAGGLLIGGRCAMSFAALASLGVLGEQIFADYNHSFALASYTQAGMLGSSFFIISLLSYILAKRSEQIAQLADEQKQTISNLEEINQYIIKHLQSGIVIVNEQQQVLMLNEAALRLAHLNATPKEINAIGNGLADAFAAWLVDSAANFVSLSLPNSAELRCHFSPLPTRHDFFYLLMFEDIALYNQRVQQSKLASLGRLTASIAHEIRNPLGAISHAGQLLAESPELSAQDQRLLDIIHSHTRRVNHIIEDILQLSRRTDSRREQIDLNQWLEKYVASFIAEQNLDNEPFKLILNPYTLMAFVDASHLKQIMDNLCQNALKYGQPQLGKIILQSRLLAQTPCIEVIDHGEGINRQQREHLFEPFFTTSSTGTGLGLYISKELAELNQAKLSYHVTSEDQTCFRLCLLNAEHTLIEL
ncbi:MAG: ATP-binding protein [Methylococcaceae bacterium]